MGRCSAFFAGGDDFTNVSAVSGGKDLRDFRDDRPGERAAGNDGRQFPPQVVVSKSVNLKIAEQEVGDDVGAEDGSNRCDPDETFRILV